MTTNRWVIHNGKFAVNEGGTTWNVVHGYMVVENDKIVHIGEALPDEDKNCTKVDGKGLFFLPGLINTHGHAAMSLLRGHGDDLALQVWLQEKMWPMEAKMTSEDVYWGTSLSVLEMLKGELQRSWTCTITWIKLPKLWSNPALEQHWHVV